MWSPASFRAAATRNLWSEVTTLSVKLWRGNRSGGPWGAATWECQACMQRGEKVIQRERQKVSLWYLCVSQHSAGVCRNIHLHLWQEKRRIAKTFSWAYQQPFKMAIVSVNSPVVSQLPAFFPSPDVPAMPSQLPPSAPLLLLTASHDDIPPYKRKQKSMSQETGIK